MLGAMPDRLLLTLDSLRWDVFCAADAPRLKALGDWKRAHAQATYTFPAHMSYFAGKLPQTLDGADHTDAVAIRFDERGRAKRAKELWRLENPEAPRPAEVTLRGANIIEGFAEAGAVTIGTGAMSWFNPALAPGRVLTGAFEHYRFFDGPDHASHRSGELQRDWLLEMLDRSAGRERFVFWNVGETHYRFEYAGCPWQGERGCYGDRALSLERQRLCLEHVDPIIGEVIDRLGDDAELVLMADHGECLGEDGLWGHGFAHPMVMRVPMLVRPARSVLAGNADAA